jgi:diguanylate cyclase (GGDEF)-like protein
VFARRATASRCSLMLVDDARNELYVRKSVGMPEDAAAIPVPVGRGLAGHVARTGVPLLVADIERLRRTTLPAPSPSQGAYRTRSCLILPLRGSRGVLGVICLADKESGAPFDELDHGALRFLADQAAQAVENALQFRQMQELAAIDELTGLSNRRQFQYALEREIQRARRYDRQLTLALFDVDHFKKYNDSCGHQAGDRALATIGEILRTSLREVDIVARYGGEEFAVILPETAAKPGSGVSPFPFLERLRRRVETAAFPGEDKLPAGRLTLSGGIACFPDDAETVKDLIGEADRALYVSKARGRNTITYRGSTVTE